MQFWLELIFGRRFHHVDFMLLRGLDAKSDQMLRIRRPKDAPSVSVLRLAIAGKGRFLFGGGVLQHHVVVFDHRAPLAIGRIIPRPSPAAGAIHPLFRPFRLRRAIGADFHLAGLVVRLTDGDHFSLLIGRQPNMAREGMLLALAARGDFAVTAAVAFRVDPKDFDLTLRAIHKRQARFLARAHAGMRLVQQRQRLTIGGVGLGHYGVGIERALPSLAPGAEHEALVGQIPLRNIDGQARGFGGFAGGLRQSLRHPRVIERRPALAFFRVHPDELMRIGPRFYAIPEMRAIRQPMRLHAVAKHFVLETRAQVLGGGVIRRLGAQDHRERGEQQTGGENTDSRH